MCGIVGAVSAEPLTESGVFDEAAALPAHRGPDDSGSCALDRYGINVRLSNRRLSIIDLTPAGRQELILARDRAGMKPLYYYEHRGALMFASELKALQRLTGPVPMDRRSSISWSGRWRLSV